MKSWQTIVGGLLVLGLLVGGIAALWWGVSFVYGRFSQIDQTVATVSLLGAVCLLLAAGIVANGSVRAKDREHSNRLQVEKAALYGRILNCWFANNPQDLADIECDLLLKAGSDVVKLYAELRAVASESGGIKPVQRAQLILAMRKDLGLSNSGISNTEFTPPPASTDAG